MSKFQVSYILANEGKWRVCGNYRSHADAIMARVNLYKTGLPILVRIKAL